jgi:hypothetical protein
MFVSFFLLVALILLGVTGRRFETFGHALDGLLTSFAGLRRRTLVLTDKGTLLESTDDGRTFAPVAAAAGWHVEGIQVVPTQDSEVQSDRAILFLAARAPSVASPYATTIDAGASWTLYENDIAQAQRYFLPHPLKRDVLSATQFADKACTISCDDRYAQSHPNTLLSLDFGKTWTKIAEYAFAVAFNDDESILLLDEPLKRGAWVDCNHFASCRLLRMPFDSAANAVLFDQQALVASEVTSATRALDSRAVFASHLDRASNSTYLSVSTDGARSFARCRFAELEVRQAATNTWNWFAVLGAPAAPSGGVLLVVVHAPNSKSGSLFVADASSPHLFRQALDRVPLSPQSGRLYASVEAVVLPGINGTLLANQFANENLTCARTFVSHDLGATWRAAPQLVNGGAYSMRIGPGIALAFNAPVDCLDDAPEAGALNLLLTIDGARTWKSVFTSSAITYELSGRGANFAVANATRSNAVSVSGDFGASWQMLNFDVPGSPDGITIQNILSQNYVGDSFALYGAAANGTGAIVAILPANEAAARACGDDEYELWTQDCALGRKITMPRKKTDAACEADQRVETARGDACACVAQVDLTCDLCACTTSSSGACKTWLSGLAASICGQGGDGQTFVAPAGSRRQPGNACSGGAAVGAAPVVACPRVLPTTTRTREPAPWDTSTLAAHDNATSQATIVGVSVGAIVGSVCVLAAVIWLVRRRRRRRHPRTHKPY